MQNKLVEKVSESRRMIAEEVRQLHGRHRQFFKVQLLKTQLDKFEPAREVKFDIERMAEGKMTKKKKKGPIDPETIKTKLMLNFCLTAVLYED